MMEEDNQAWLFSTPLAMLLLCGAVAIFLLGYLPENRKANECEELVRMSRSRIDELCRQEERAKRRIAELAANDPEAISEAIREILRQGRAFEYLPADQ